MSKPSPIVFENLDGSTDDPEDGGYVDPLDLEDHEQAAPDDDPRAGDPFAVKGDEDEPAPLEPADDPEEDKAEDRKAKKDQEAIDAQPDLKAENERLRRELEDLRRDDSLSRKEAAEARKELLEERGKHIAAEIEQAKRELKVAIEEGEADKQVEINERLAALHANKLQITHAKEADERGTVDRRPAEDDTPRVVAHTPMAEQWMRGRSWVNNPAYKQQNRDLLRIGKAVYEDGYDANKSDFYEEVERRMKRAHPALFEKAQPPARQPGRQQVGRVSRDDPPRPNGNGRGKVTLTAEDVKTMRRFHLDPNNADHVKEFAKNKIRDQRSGAVR